jgi:glucose-6-phosphate dehydrogenase assembly protein OpcA
MAPAVNPLRVAGTPERADVAGIERELRRLWSSLDGGPSPAASAGDAHATRICTLTLLAVVRNSRSAEAAALAERLGERYPSRSIVLDLRTPKAPEAESRLDVEIALHCHARDATGRQAVCCEQIAVTAAGRAITRVPALVLPLLVPDLPVYVWWPADPPAAPDPATEVLRRLAEVADVLIVDSAAMRRPLEGLAAAAVFAGPLPGGLRDLTWGRLTPWRDLIVQSFDPSPMRQALERLERVRIRTQNSPVAGMPAVSGSDAGGPAAALPSERDPVAGLLLGAWLAGRLGWEPAGPVRRDGGTLRALFWRDGGGLQLDVDGGAGPVTSFECSAAGGEPFSLSITRQPDGAPAADIETRVGRSRPRTTTAGLATADETALLGAELELTGADAVLREALAIALRMVPRGRDAA